jgi:hypothetical protein
MPDFDPTREIQRAKAHAFGYRKLLDIECDLRGTLCPRLGDRSRVLAAWRDGLRDGEHRRSIERLAWARPSSD